MAGVDMVPIMDVPGSSRQSSTDEIEHLATTQVASQFPQMIEVVTEGFQNYLLNLVQQPLPQIVDLAGAFDTLEVDPTLQVTRDGVALSGKDLWQALLTRDTQQHLLEVVVQLITWNLETSKLVFGPAETKLYELLQTHYLNLIPTLTTPGTSTNYSDAIATGAEPQFELIGEALESFPDLRSIWGHIALMSPEEVVKELSEVLTDGIIGYIADVTDRTVRNWVSGKHKVRRRDSLQLRVALAAVRALAGVEKPKVILRWFANENNELDGDAPANVLRDGKQYAWVIRAAASYALEGA